MPVIAGLVPVLEQEREPAVRPALAASSAMIAGQTLLERRDFAADAEKHWLVTGSEPRSAVTLHSADSSAAVLAEAEHGVAVVAGAVAVVANA